MGIGRRTDAKAAQSVVNCNRSTGGLGWFNARLSGSAHPLGRDREVKSLGGLDAQELVLRVTSA
jgi:hypothetical protein